MLVSVPGKGAIKCLCLCCQNDSLLLSSLAAKVANLEGIESRMSQLDNGPSTTPHQTAAAASDPSNTGHCHSSVCNSG